MLYWFVWLKISQTGLFTWLIDFYSQLGRLWPLPSAENPVVAHPWKMEDNFVIWTFKKLKNQRSKFDQVVSRHAESKSGLFGLTLFIWRAQQQFVWVSSPRRSQWYLRCCSSGRYCMSWLNFWLVSQLGLTWLNLKDYMTFLEVTLMFLWCCLA